MKKTILKELILGLLDAFLILFFLIMSAVTTLKNGLNFKSIILFVILTIIWPLLTKLVVTYILKEDNKMNLVLNHLLHIISGYIIVIIIFILANSIFSNLFIVSLSYFILTVLYLENGEYQLNLHIMCEDEIRIKDSFSDIKKDVNSVSMTKEEFYEMLDKLKEKRKKGE